LGLNRLAILDFLISGLVIECDGLRTYYNTFGIVVYSFYIAGGTGLLISF